MPYVNAAWLNGWDKRVKITIDQNDISAGLSGFPVLIYISSSSGRNNEDITFIFDEVGANSLKIAVTESDGTTECYVEVEKWDFGNEKAWIWTKIPSITHDADTEIYLYYDNDHADNVNYVGAIESIPAENVWDANFLAVYHLRDKTTSSIADSTDNDRDGTKGSANNPIEVTGIIDKGQDFSTDYITLTNMQNANSGTVEAWVNPDTIDAFQGIVLDDLAGYLILSEYPEGYFGFAAYDTEADWLQSSQPFSTGSWYHIAGTYALGVKRLLYVQGALDDTSLSNFGGLGGTANPLKMGKWSVDQDLNGQLDEVRVSDIARSAAWIEATYETGRDDLLDFEIAIADDGENWLTGWFYRKQHTIIGSADGIQTNYQVGIKVYYGSGTDGTETVTGLTFGKVYADSKCETDFGDIRFTSSDGSTELDYWIESKTDSNSAIIWVEIPSIPVSPNTLNIYIYYGKTCESTTSDGKATFPMLFDHFLGSSLNLTVWTVDASDGSVTIANSIAKVQGNAGNNRYSFCSDAPYRDVDPAAIRFRSLIESTSAIYQITQMGWSVWGLTGQAQFKSYHGSHQAFTIDSLGNSETDIISVGYFNSYKTYEISRDGTNSKFYVDGTLVATGDFDPDTVTIGAQIYVRDSEYDLYSDWVLIREWTPNEPTHGAWGSEEVSARAPDLLFGAGFNASSPYVELHWNHSMVNVQFFEVQNSSDNVSWDYLGQSTTNNYTDDQVSNGTERYYRVRACNQTDGSWYNGSFSNVNFEKVYFNATVAGPAFVNIPQVNLIEFNTTIAGNICGVSGDFSDIEGLSGYIFWNNATNQPTGVNSSFTALVGVSDSALENVTLPTARDRFGARYYVNDTGNNWGVATLVVFPTVLNETLPCGHNIFNASSIDIIVGTLNDGNLASTYFVDDDWYNVSEINAVPGLDVRFNFSNVGINVTCGCIEFYQTYTGHSNHEIFIQAWNFTATSWVTLGSFLYNETAGWVCVGLGHDPHNFFSGYTMHARFYHEGQGHLAHEIHVDRINLRVVYAEEGDIIIEYESEFPWLAIAIILSIITALLVWMKFGNQ